MSTLGALLGEGLSVGEDEIAEAASPFGPVNVAALSDPIRLAQVVDLFTELHRLGASLADAHRLTPAEPDTGAGSLARQLLRSRTTAANWPRLLAPIMNRLRERQRDALVDHLVAREHLAGPEQLYAWFLIDPLRSSCFKTTRLLQGISAVQLFVQRCLLGLERPMTKERFDAECWEWMCTYRVWEANRKVFLYPENWLLPELRDDKSSAYKTLEGSLSQGEASNDAAEAALLAYLDGLADIADIEVAGMWDEAGDLYVTGRTNSPRGYFWRVCRDFASKEMRWSAWERIDLPITGTHVIPFILDGALHIAWPEFRQIKKDEDTQQWEAQLAWSRRTDRGWSKVSLSEHKIRADVMYGKDERSTFTFRAERSTATSTLSVLNVPGLTSSSTVTISCFTAYHYGRIRPHLSTVTEYKAWDGSARTKILADTFVKYPDGVYGYADNAVVLAIAGPPNIFARILPPLGNGVYSANAQKWDAAGNTPDALALDGTMVHAIYKGRGLLEVLHHDKNRPPLSNWRPVFIFDAEPDELPPEDQVAPNRPVMWKRPGEFVMSRGGLTWVGAELSSDETDILPGESRSTGLEPTYGRRVTIPVFDLGFRERDANNANPADMALLEPGQASIRLGPTPGHFVVTPAASDRPIWHYQDPLGSYFLAAGGLSGTDPSAWLAYAEANDCLRDLRSLGRAGLARLLAPETQNARDGGGRFNRLNATPPPVTVGSVLDQGITFAANAPSSGHYWELFLHGPLAIADHLSRQRRFEDAQRWLHFVFSPLRLHDANALQAWRFVPFQTLGRPDRIGDLLSKLAEAKADGRDSDLSAAIKDWRKQPFRPHAVARMRPSAYQWRTLFAYLDNILAWADDRFARATRESIDEATLLYVLAAQLLGPRPRTIAPRLQPLPATYRQLRSIDAFGNAWLAFADDPRLLLIAWLEQHGVVSPKPGAETAVLSSLGTTYFCVPANPALVGYWDRVEDRLFKIRHCQDIDGGALDLPLYDPPIDPLLLVRAVAAGVSIGDAVSANAALPRYRFNVLVQKANELAAELESLGGAFLAALEKLDGERLAQLRSSHEIELLALVGDVRKDQLRESRLNLDGLRLSRRIVAGRYRQYQLLLGKADSQDPAEGKRVPEESPGLSLGAGGAPGFQVPQGLGLTSTEGEQLTSTRIARNLATAEAVVSLIGTTAFAVSAYPTLTFLAGLGQATRSTGESLKAIEGVAQHDAGLSALIGGYERRRQEWAFQSNAAGRELAQLDTQIVAGDVRVAIAQKELDNHGTQLENARELDSQMHEKFTNDRLYGWMTDQLSRAFFSTYQLAVDVAKKAERAYKYELGVEASATSYIQPGCWDSLKNGLLAGEKLSLDLKRMEVAYLDRNARELELTKHVSLLQLNPEELLKLKGTEACDIDLPEWLFDLDCPGHYFRRLKTVGLSIPCVSGPYASVNCTLTLVKSSVRVDSNTAGTYRRDLEKDDDTRFRDDPSAAQRVVTSSGVNDSGLFETDLRDERYLPFEGRGAISTWHLELPTTFKQFDYETISDVVLHVRYTARDGGDALKQKAEGELEDAVNGIVAAASEGDGMSRLFSLRHEFPTAWHRFTSTSPAADARSQEFVFDKPRFPFFLGDRRITITEVTLYVVPRRDVSSLAFPAVTITPPGASAAAMKASMPIGPLLGNTIEIGDGVVVSAQATDAAWTLGLPAANVAAFRRDVDDVLMVCRYRVG